MKDFLPDTTEDFTTEVDLHAYEVFSPDRCMGFRDIQTLSAYISLPVPHDSSRRPENGWRLNQQQESNGSRKKFAA